MPLIAAPAIILPVEKPALVRAHDLRGLPSWQEMRKRLAEREAAFPFPTFCPVTAAAGKTLIYKSRQTPAPAGAVATASSVDIGTAQSDRRVHLGVAAYQGSVSSLASATVGGVSCVENVQQNQPGVADMCAAIYTANVPSGTTANIVVTGNASINNISIAVWISYGLTSDTAIDADKSTSDPGSLTLGSVAGGFCLAIIGVRGANTSVTWTGLANERFDVGSTNTNSAADDTTSSSSVSFSADPASSGSFRYTLGATF